MMQPSFLPKELKGYADPAIDSEEKLFKKLVAVPADLLSYFEVACDDEMWVNSHTDFMGKAVEWFTLQSFNDKLTAEYARRAADALRRHFRYLGKFVHSNKRVKLSDKEYTLNTLLITTISEPIKQGYLRCRERQEESLVLSELSSKEFVLLYEYATNGTLVNLWKQGLKELRATLDLAVGYDIVGLVKEAEEMMCKWVTAENALELLKTSITKGWLIVKEKAIEVINKMAWGFSLSSPYPEGILTTFHNFTTITVEHYANVLQLTTEIACAGNWVNDSAFSKVVRETPHLRGVELSHTPAWSPYFADTPPGVVKLDLSYCEWLNNEYLETLSKSCPKIEELNLESDNQLDFSSWGSLLKFKKLKKLNLTRCQRISNDDLKIILQACPSLLVLNLTECTKIRDEGFFEIAHSNKGIVKLNLTRTHISDTALVEIGAGCTGLLSIVLSRCNDLTEKGVVAFVKAAHTLEELDITDLHYATPVTEAAKKLRPRLQVKAEGIPEG